MEDEFVVINEPSPRLRTRKVNEAAWAAIAKRKAQTSGDWYVLVKHGGAVANSYGYSARTEAALIVADPQGRVVVWLAKLRANKVTDAGCAEACLPGTRAIWDGRFKSEKAVAKAWTVIRNAHAEHRVMTPKTVFDWLNEA